MPHILDVNQIESIINEFCSKNDERFEQTIFKDTSSAWTQELNKSKYKIVILTDVCTVNIYNPTTGTLLEVAADDNFVGTVAEWNQLTPEEKAKYRTCDFTDDESSIGIGLHVVNGQLYCRYRSSSN